jgi:hypothetical protein
MHSLIFHTVDTIQRQHHINCSGSRLRSMLRTTAGSLSGGGFLSGGLLYPQTKFEKRDGISMIIDYGCLTHTHWGQRITYLMDKC